MKICIVLALLAAPLPADPAATLASNQSDPADYIRAAESLLADSPPDEKTLTLISKRIASLFQSDAPPTLDRVPDLSAACQLALLLHRADPKSALPVLRTHTPNCLAAAAIGGSAGHRFLTYAATFCQLRFESGEDPAALDEYVALLPTADPDEFSQLPGLLRFLLSYPDDSKLATLADSLFNKTDGEWNPIVGFKNRYYGGYNARDIYREPLLWKHPAFKKQLARLLADTAPAGEVSIIDSTAYAISISEGWTDTVTDPAFEGTLPAAGSKFSLRLSDFHALHAARQPGAPPFQPFWPQDKKDAALTELKKFYHPSP